jgi:lipopolysaccharide/colanic/teichoic acid biosynthesis glycosyltransferase
MILLVLLDAKRLLDDRKQKLGGIESAVFTSMRETDIAGWYEQGSVAGIVFTEISGPDKESIRKTIFARLTSSLCNELSRQQADHVRLSFHFFPEDWDGQSTRFAVDEKLYPDLRQAEQSKKISHFIKRLMDITGSLAAMVVLFPLFVAISLIVKLTSAGPVLFKQERVGEKGALFTFLKFRTMRDVSDSEIHKAYVKQLISRKIGAQPGDSEHGCYKMQNDPRVTAIGRVLRKTSLDELPQFWNVLKGQMCLVGPRPPIPYELESYDTWHRRRILEAKPGITGLWQVKGRSRTNFDDMVRLDLRYARTWSPWLDIKILLQTPQAVFSGEGAF